ncbi:hypothetical protein HanRHA438_Chr04g0190061 [Helianthus annuus]|uniref:Uncharacterized protein n=2 Tax=Helianthus annuus TaxID=4232 RepID=A0A9K3JA24_HELAN|nr:hypothetical protein HanXRQr2_Chr04g0180371 [Helianthus annuus]KAJ0582006.1 hypothetical protein HanHA300_Chr04g0147471 [Helianthus annuus]KAJ0590133.1 hypothetical protein HanIR_Chr04g0194051 [Helianthus annuus]KAJ0597989.1 hypothetical protein HanHA89_Chr04g0160831 [Helianthus annuus]KAJ0758620.1 hypothetical protein HanLR1_Chr04g0152421 [Helianthus annuus]
MQLTNLNASTIRLVQIVFNLYHPFHIQSHKEAGEEKQHTLLAMRAIVQHLCEINQEVFSECKEEWGHSDLFPLVYDYFGIIHGTSVLCNKGFRLLEAASDSWLTVKLALEQIVAKIRTENDYGYKEMLEQLNDLEAAKGIRFCDDFFTLFAFICMRIITFSRHLYDKMQDMKKCKSMIRLEEVSSITIMCIFRTLSTYMCTDKQLQELRRAHSYRTWLDVIKELLPAIRGGSELHIGDFEVNAVVLQELKMKMVRFASFTRENEEEIMIVINKLEKRMNEILMTIEDMRRDAHLCSLDIREVGITLNQFIVDSNIQLSVTGVRFLPLNEEQQYESPASEAMTILYRATLFLIHTDLNRYICACEKADDSSLISCHSIIHDNTRCIIQIICDPSLKVGESRSLDDILKVITCLHEINQEGFTVISECKEEWRHDPQVFDLMNDYHKIYLQTSQLYKDFVRFLKGQCDSRLGIILTLKEFVVNWRQDDYEAMIWNLNGDGRLTLSGEFLKSLACTCKQAVAFTRHIDEEVQELKSVKVLAKVSSGLIAGVFSVMAAYMVDCTPFQWMAETPLTCVWLHLIRCFTWDNPLRNIPEIVINDFLFIDSLLCDVKARIDSFPSAVTYGTGVSSFAVKEDMVSLLDNAAQKMDKLLVTIEEMSRHADTIEAGIRLELNRHNHMLPIKRKR